MMKEKQIFSRQFVELSGCIHNHSEYSFDCDVSPQKIIVTARKKGLDYITINDHRNVSAGNDEAVQNEKNLLVLSGMEMNDPNNNNHLLVFGSDIILKGKSAEEYTKFYLENGAATFIAHPFEDRRTNEFRKYIWTNKENTEFHGLEIWNAVSEWLGSLNPKKNGFFQVFFPAFFIKRANSHALQYWDELAVNGIRKAAIGSVDAHTIKHNWHGIRLTFLSHGKLFQTIRTNVFIENEHEPCRNDVLKALQKGNSYIVNYKLGNPYQFYAGVCDSDGNGVIFGEEIEWKKELRFFYRLPKIAKVILIQNGKKIAVQRDEKGYFPVPAPGVYRLEIHRWGRGWIYTNHIHVTEKK